MNLKQVLITVIIIIVIILTSIQAYIQTSIAIGYSEYLMETGLPDSQDTYILYLEEEGGKRGD